jgi:hypothetical protein
MNTLKTSNQLNQVLTNGFLQIISAITQSICQKTSIGNLLFTDIFQSYSWKRSKSSSIQESWDITTMIT